MCGAGGKGLCRWKMSLSFAPGKEYGKTSSSRRKAEKAQPAVIGVRPGEKKLLRETFKVRES